MGAPYLQRPSNTQTHHLTKDLYLLFCTATGQGYIEPLPKLSQEMSRAYLGVCAKVHQQLYHRHMASLAGPMQRSPPHSPLRLHAHSPLPLCPVTSLVVHHTTCPGG